MSHEYNLTVVIPFHDYQRGSIITDQEIVKNILDPNHEYHPYIHNVRKTVAPQKINEPVSSPSHVVEISTVTLDSNPTELTSEDLGDVE